MTSGSDRNLNGTGQRRIHPGLIVLFIVVGLAVCAAAIGGVWLFGRWIGLMTASDQASMESAAMSRGSVAQRAEPAASQRQETGSASAPTPAAEPRKAGPGESCRSSYDCAPDGFDTQMLCVEGTCKIDWWCMCYYEIQQPGNSMVPSTGCRRGRSTCENLRATSIKGSASLVPNGMIRDCVSVPSTHPAERLGGYQGWSDSKRPGAVQRIGACVLP